ncbi:hypothetical protein Taro_022018, partial [Colocasia esculenta]|nr:hypothetical protein [Colocasia esculenta]
LPGEHFCKHHYLYLQQSKRGTRKVGGVKVRREKGKGNGATAARVRASEGKEEEEVRAGSGGVQKQRREKRRELRGILESAAEKEAKSGVRLGKRKRDVMKESSDEQSLKLDQMESSPELEDKVPEKVKKRERKGKKKFVVRKRPKRENAAMEKEVVPEEDAESSPVSQPPSDTRQTADFDAGKTEKDLKKRLLKGPDAIMCHQCQRNDKGRVVSPYSAMDNNYRIAPIRGYGHGKTVAAVAVKSLTSAIISNVAASSDDGSGCTGLPVWGCSSAGSLVLARDTCWSKLGSRGFPSSEKSSFLSPRKSETMLWTVPGSLVENLIEEAVEPSYSGHGANIVCGEVGSP